MIAQWYQHTLEVVSPWLFSAALLLIAVGLLMRLPLEKELSWFWPLSRIKKLLTMVVVVMIAHTVVPKGDGGNGGDPMRSPRMAQRQLASAPESSSAYCGMFPALTNAVANVCATGILPAETSVVVRVHQPAGLYPVSTGIEVYASPTLAPDVWNRIGTAPIVGGTDGTIIEFPYLLLPDGWTNSMFFAFGLTDDLDGDGLPDRVEIGTVEEMPANAMSWCPVMDYQYVWPPSMVADVGFATVSLPCPYTVNGVTYSKMKICLDGMVYLLDPDHEDLGATSSFVLPPSLAHTQLSQFHVALVAFGDDLAFDGRNRLSRARYGTTNLPSGPASVIEFESFFFFSELHSEDPHTFSFQVVLPSNEPNDVYFVYATMYPGSYYAARNISIGVQCPMLASIREGDDYYNLTCESAAESFEFWRKIKVSIGHGTDPNSSDTDGDGFSDGDEVKLFMTDPMVPDVDTDSDGLPDAAEIRIGTDPANVDSDYDGLNDFDEVTIGTDPLQPDTDGDGMNDGWEYAHDGETVICADPYELPPEDPVAFDPTVDNRYDDDYYNDPSADPDCDGLTNAEECAAGTDPCVPDTDGDGADDHDEVGQGSDPTDATDEGDPRSRVAVSFYFGDHSGSHSEKYRLEVNPLQGVGTRPRSFSKLNENYGECETNTVYLKPGWSYEVRLFHSGTKPGESVDYDYTLEQVGNLPANVFVVDDDSLFGVSEASSYFAGDGKVVHLYVLGNPRLVFDYDRDGKIDDADVAKAKQGKTFRFWINDDNDTGDTNDSENDRPGSGPNHANGQVDGKCDLLDFTPVWIDRTEVFPPGAPQWVTNALTWKLRSTCVNAVWTWIGRENAGAFQHESELYDCGQTLTDLPECADVVGLASGTNLPPLLAQAMRLDPNSGVFLIEGCAVGTDLSIEGLVSAGDAENIIVRHDANIRISGVEDMYRWKCLRSVCGDLSDIPSRLESPTNWPDAECDTRHFVFVHGYSVDVQSARGWAAEMFKRLWQSGSQSMFTAVDWFGNESQITSSLPFVGDASPNYYVNVRHALDSALALKNACDSLPGEMVMLAHSLGNMVVASAAKDYGLRYSKYYMLNAAVPIEAFDATADNAEMHEHGWIDVPPYKWAANWHERIPYENDPRRTLKWRGRFSGIHDVINCYSPTEDILDNATADGWGGFWSIQELFKGTATLHFAPGNCEGGWGYNGDHTNWRGVLTEFAKTNEFTDAELIASPIFRKFDNVLLHQTNLISTAQTELNKVMGDGIPATSYAAGRNQTGGVSDNYNYQSQTMNGWPSQRQKRQGDVMVDAWLHSDIKNVAFYYVHKFFEKIVKGE